MNDRHVEAKGNIERSIVITGDGNSAVLNFGDVFTMPLDRKQIPPRVRVQPNGKAPPNLLKLLAPDAGVLPLVGRFQLLDDLQGWLDDDAEVSVQTLIARAGSGKTRLAVELCKRVDGAQAPGQSGWVAGFIRPGNFAAVADKLATTHYHWQQPTLLVIDYAAAVHRPLADWLDQLESETLESKLRILLLEREAPDGFGWWHELTRPLSNSAASRRNLFVDPDRPLFLPDLGAGEDRHKLLIATHAEAQKMLGGAANHTPFAAYGDDPRFDEARFGNPLNLAMAGIIAAERGPDAAFGLRRLDAARHLARHEVRRIELIAKGNGVDPSAACHALGFNNLCGGMALESILADLTSELNAAGKPAPTAALATILQQELPSAGTRQDDDTTQRLGTTQPDLIGEGVIVEALLCGSPAERLATGKLVQRAYGLTAKRTAEALMRLIQDFGHALEDASASAEDRHVAQTILGLFHGLAKAIPDEEVFALEALIFTMPENSLVLREAAAEQTARLVTLWSKIAKATGDESARAHLATWQNNLANRLGDLGQREPALKAAQEAVDLRRALAAARPDAFTPNLAMSLNTLANRLSDLGQREPALKAAQEAVDLYRALSAARPDAFTPNLAMSLNTLANSLSDLGKHEPALKAAQEAVDLRRVLAAARPDAFTPNLAMALNNLANMLSDLGQREPALKAAQEAVDLYRALSAARPDAFTPNLAMSLNTLANSLSDLGKHEPALKAAQEAVDLRRVLAAARPDAFTPDLAGSLNNLANSLSAVGERERSLAAAHEAVDLLRILAAARPDAFIPNLAMSLNNLASSLSDLGEREPALAVAQEAVDLRRALAAARPDAFIPDLASSLNNLANRLSALGEREPALKAAQEAVNLNRGLAAARPDAFAPNLARSLCVLGHRLEELDRMDEAVAADHAAVSKLNPYFHMRPAAFASLMKFCLRNYIRRAEKAEIAIDTALVTPIIEKLQAMHSGDTP